MKKRILLTISFIVALFSITTYAQTVSGKVSDAQGSPLVGASILVKGSSNGTVTDANGSFTLNNVAKGSTLVVSFVGFTNLEVPSDGNLDLTLEEGSALGELLVTAENRSVSAQTVPIMMDLVSGKAIQRNGATDLLSLQNLAPGLNIVTNTIFNQINVRGVGSNDGAAELSDQAVTIGIDGEYINRPVALNASLFDLERVEVLKGPQGTLYGRNATAGAVNIIAKKPVIGRTELDVNAGYGNYNTLKANAVLNLPLGKMAAFRVGGMLSKHDGYRDGGATADTKDNRIDNGNVWGMRAGLSINPSKAFSIYIAGDYNKTDQLAPSQYGVNVSTADTTQRGQAPAKFKTTLPKDFPVDTAGGMAIDQYAVRAKLAYDFGTVKITYTGGYRDVKLLGYQPLNGFVPEGFSFHNDLKYQTQSHELRINGESQSLIWQAGIYHGNEDQQVSRGLILASVKGLFGGKKPFLNFFMRDVNSKTTGVFGQATYNVTEKLGVTGGLRYTSDKKSRIGADLAAGPMPPNAAVTRFFYPNAPTSMTQTGMKALASTAPSSDTWSKLTWLVNLDYKIDPNKMIFAKVSTGYKAGGFDNIGYYDEENLTAVEVGTKNKFLDNKLRLNGSIFRYWYRDQQFSVFQDVTVGGRIQNAGKTDITGIEIEGEAALSQVDRVRFSVNYLNAQFGDGFKLARNRVGVGVDSVVAKGLRPIQSPKWTITLGYDHDFAIGEGNLNVGIQTMYKSEYYLTNVNFLMDRQEGFTKTDAFITYTAKGSQWDIGAYVHNIEDNRILNYAGFTGGTINLYNWIFGAPRLFGIQANYRFRGKSR